MSLRKEQGEVSHRERSIKLTFKWFLHLLPALCSRKAGNAMACTQRVIALIKVSFRCLWDCSAQVKEVWEDTCIIYLWTNGKGTKSCESPPWSTPELGPGISMSRLWEREGWESRKDTGGSVSQEFQSGARGGTARPVWKDSWASWNWLWEQKTSNRMFKEVLFFKGDTLREAIGHQAQVTSLGEF